MRESVLRDYFLGHVDETRLSEEIAGSAIKTSYDVIDHHITDDLLGDFEINATSLVRLCDAFLNDKLQAAHLEFIGLALVASDHFIWEPKKAGFEDSSLATTIHSWASPEINYPLTREVIGKFRHLLETDDSLFTSEDIAKTAKKKRA